MALVQSLFLGQSLLGWLVTLRHFKREVCVYQANWWQIVRNRALDCLILHQLADQSQALSSCSLPSSQPPPAVGAFLSVLVPTASNGIPAPQKQRSLSADMPSA